MSTVRKHWPVTKVITIRTSFREPQWDVHSCATDDWKIWRSYSEATERNPKDSDCVSAECSVHLTTVKFCSSTLCSLSSGPNRLSLANFITVSVSTYRMTTWLHRNVGKYVGMGRVKSPTSVQGKGICYGISL
jgi:hypothetical protein